MAYHIYDSLCLSSDKYNMDLLNDMNYVRIVAAIIRSMRVVNEIKGTPVNYSFITRANVLFKRYFALKSIDKDTDSVFIQINKLINSNRYIIDEAKSNLMEYRSDEFTMTDLVDMTYYPLTIATEVKAL